MTPEEQKKLEEEKRGLIAATLLGIVQIFKDKTFGDAGFIERVSDQAIKSAATATAQSLGSSISKSEVGGDIGVKKKWNHAFYTSPLEPRDNHKRIDGEVVAIDDKFSVGYNPRESISASNDYNCGCGMEAIFGGTSSTIGKVFVRKKAKNFEEKYDTGDVISAK